MKKTYINPLMEIVKIASQTQMLAGSPGLGGQFTGGTPEGRKSGDEDLDW